MNEYGVILHAPENGILLSLRRYVLFENPDLQLEFYTVFRLSLVLVNSRLAVTCNKKLFHPFYAFL